MEAITDISFKLDVQSLLKRAHIRSDSEDAHEFGQLLELARQVGKPKALYTEAYVGNGSNDTVSLNGITFKSLMLRENLSNVERVFPFIVTCGREMDKVSLSKQNFLEQFWWDTIKTSLLMSAHQYLHELVVNRYLLKKTASMSPGSGDENVWPIIQQRELFELLGDVPDQIGVELTDSCLMVPNKTISGILIPTERDFRTCQVCHREGCPSRSAPFDQGLWESINKRI